jgi:ribosome assembly protein SQT1
MASGAPHHHDDLDSEPEMLNAEDALEEFEVQDGEDVDMDSGDDDEPVELDMVNDSIAYFDAHNDSVFAIAQHPLRPALVATGGSEGDADDAPGKGYVVDTSAAESRPVLPASYSSDPAAAGRKENAQLEPLFALDGHSDSVTALAFSLPDGGFLASGCLDGRLRVFSVNIAGATPSFAFVAEAKEVDEVNWIAACPSSENPNVFAIGASDGSVWIYSVTASGSDPLQLVATYFLHTASCTAGSWSADGALLATVSEDGSLYVWDPWGAAEARGVPATNGAVVALTAADARFAVEGGLYSVAVSPTGGTVAVGGAGGVVKIVGLPRIASTPGRPQQQDTAARRAGTVLASLQVQSESVETLAWAPLGLPLLAAGSVDGSVAVYDASRSFALRRHIAGAHGEFSVVRVEWVRSSAGGPAAQQQWLLTSCGLDGVVRRWDLHAVSATGTGGAAATAAQAGLVKEWRGHRGGGDGGGVLGFVQGETGERVITAGDDGVVLVFEA